MHKKRRKKKRKLLAEDTTSHQEQEGVRRSKAIDNISLEIPDGSFTVIVGPSGCGKSTTLRIIAGLEGIDEGEIYIGEKKVNDVRPSERNIAMVFQNYAIYPTMTVRENITFGLENRKVSRDEIEMRLKEVAHKVGLEPYLDRRPAKLSGGQRQRVALARAIIKRPELYIFDEPLSNLDAKLRAEMRSELIAMHDELKTTFIYVTHDQVEAMSMADQIVLMNFGEIIQVGSPLELYNDPATTFVAEFMGTPGMNILNAAQHKDISDRLHTPCTYIGFRPEKGLLMRNGVPGQGCLALQSRVVTRELLGAEALYKVENICGMQVVKTADQTIEPGSQVVVDVNEDDLYYFDENQNRIRTVSHVS